MEAVYRKRSHPDSATLSHPFDFASLQGRRCSSSALAFFEGE